MARFIIKSTNEYAVKLSMLTDGAIERQIAGKAIHEGANIVANEIKARLIQNLNDPESVSKKRNILFKNYYNKPTGDLLASFGISKMQRDEDGYNVKIGFDGYDKHGVANQLKARVMESGSSVLRKRPFVRPAVKQTKAQAIEKMGEVIDEEIAQIMNE